MFDNAPSHQKRAADAVSAHKMPKKSTAGWTHIKNGLQLCKGLLPNGSEHDFYCLDTHPTMPGWFKGMEVIIWKQGLWPESGKLKAEHKGFKCEAGSCTCCCWQLIFTQPDFCSHCSELAEYIKSCGHICNFYLKYHCELNFIE